MPTRNLFENPSFSPSYTHEVKEIANCLFSNTDITYFMYLRGALDGSLSVLVSDAAFLTEWLKTGYPLNIGYSDDYKSAPSFSYFWKDKFPKELLSLAQKTYHLHNGVSIVNRYKTYFEMFGFADSNPQDTMGSAYISCMVDLKNFSRYFLKAGRHLIQKATQHPLPAAYALPNSHEICLSKHHTSYLATGLLGDTYLTSQEFFSLQLFLNRKSHKEIGRILSISPKTVEKYMANMRKKLGYSPRDIAFLHECNGKVHLTPLPRTT